MNASSMYPTTTPTALTHVDRSVRKRIPAYTRDSHIRGNHTRGSRSAYTRHSRNAYTRRDSRNNGLRSSCRPTDEAVEAGRWLGERAGDLELSCLPALGVFDQRFNSAG
jgi:hypothetical protein